MHNVYGEPAYHNIAAKLKQQLRETCEALNETGQQYPHVRRVIETHWND